MRIHTNDITWELTPQLKTGDQIVQVKQPSFEQIIMLYQMLRDEQIFDRNLRFQFSTENYTEDRKQIMNHFKVIHAAGGIVMNEDSILFIHRLNKWDLPKGKVEKGEDYAEAAVREVEEECNLKAAITFPIGETWHTYQGQKNEILKCTHWFGMLPIGELGELKPQTEEGIEQVIWVKREDIEEKILTNTYKSIYEIYKKFEFQIR